MFTARRGFLPDEDAEWIRDIRHELDALYLRALECYAQACLGVGGTELAGAERAGRELTKLAPYRESGYRHLMRALAAQRQHRGGAARLRAAAHAAARGARDRAVRGNARAPRPTAQRPRAGHRLTTTEASTRPSSRRADRSPGSRARWAPRRPGSPPRAAGRPGTVTMNGTGFSECAVLGLPSSSSMWSELPWSAVITHAPPDSCTAATIVPRQRVHGLDRRGPRPRSRPVWPTMSELAKLMIPNVGSSSRQASTNASAASRALISGLWS